jgi:septum formation protein
MLILASASPRRRELLMQAGYTFEVQAASLFELPRPGEDGIRLAIRLAREKATAVLALRREARSSAGPAADRIPAPVTDPIVVLGADTVVVCDRELLGKPSDPADAARMLRLLSGRTHQVITGVAVAFQTGAMTTVEVAAELTHVTMQTLSDSEISRYIATGEPMDKAGAYAIQGYAGRWIPRIQGCYFNVVGLPLALVSSLLEGSQNRLAQAVPEATFSQG